MRRRAFISSSALLFSFTLTPLWAGSNNTLRIQGSGASVPLIRRWAEEYMKKHKEATVQVIQESSGTAVTALLSGSADIVKTFQPLKDSEKAQLLNKCGKPVVETPVALEAIGIYVNPDNPVTELNLHQLKSIYSGRVTDWMALGSTLGRITAYKLEESSDPYDFFKENVLNNDGFGTGAVGLPVTPEIIEAIRRDSQAIGYGGIVNAKGIKILPLKKDEQGDAVEPTLENIARGKYPLSRKIFFDTAGPPEGPAKAFVDWVLGSPGQKIGLAAGYFPILKEPKSPSNDHQSKDGERRLIDTN